MDYSPWPAPGRWFRFEINRAYALTAKYNGIWPRWTVVTGRKFRATWGRWPFLSVILGRVRFYIGWKPVTLRDTQFEVPDDFPRSAAATEFSFRWAAGEIS